MVFIPIGMAAFFLLLVFDWAECESIAALGAVALALSALTLGLSAAFLAALLPRVDWPLAARIAFAAIAALFLFLLVVSLFVEIRFVGGTKGERRLQTKGTYALVRHPGVLWFFPFSLFAALATGSLPLLIAVPFWTLANGILVAIEDKVFFPRLFGEAYSEYRRTVPFLVPSRESASNCLSTFSLHRSNTKWERK